MVNPGPHEIDEIRAPDGWELLYIGEHFEFKNGLNKAKKYFGHGTPIINYMDVYKYPGLFLYQIVGKVDVNSEEKRAYSVRKGDVFFTRTSETPEEIGIASVLIDDVEDGVFSGFVLRARPNTNAFNNDFKKYCFSSSAVRKQIQSTSSYTTRALTNGRLLSQVVVPAPIDIEEQKAIAEVLSDVDALIEHLEALIAKKGDIKTATMQQLFAIDDSSNITEFGKVCSLRKTRCAPASAPEGSKSIELEHIQAETGIVLDKTPMLELVSLKSSYKQGDILFGKLRSYLRKFHLAQDSGYCSTEIWVIVPDKDVVEPEYLYNVVQTNRFIEAASEAYGTHMPRADWGVVSEFKMKLPSSLKEQKKVASVLMDMEKEINELRNQSVKLQGIKQGMMQELLTGRTRLI